MNCDILIHEATFDDSKTEGNKIVIYLQLILPNFRCNKEKTLHNI